MCTVQGTGTNGYGCRLWVGYGQGMSMGHLAIIDCDEAKVGEKNVQKGVQFEEDLCQLRNLPLALQHPVAGREVAMVAQYVDSDKMQQQRQQLPAKPDEHLKTAQAALIGTDPAPHPRSGLARLMTAV